MKHNVLVSLSLSFSLFFLSLSLSLSLYLSLSLFPFLSFSLSVCLSVASVLSQSAVCRSSLWVCSLAGANGSSYLKRLCFLSPQLLTHWPTDSLSFCLSSTPVPQSQVIRIARPPIDVPRGCTRSSVFYVVVSYFQFPIPYVVVSYPLRRGFLFLGFLFCTSWFPISWFPILY